MRRLAPILLVAPLALPLAVVGCNDRGLFGRGGFDSGAGFSCGVESDEPLRAGFVTALDPDGCRWMVTALDDDGYRALTLDVPAFADAVGGSTVSVTYTLPDDAVRLTVRTGCGLAEGTCTTARSEPLVVRTYEPTAGTVTVDAAPTEDGALATITLAGIELVSEYDETASIGEVTWTDLALYPAPAE